MDTIRTRRYSEEEIDDMIEEYKCKFGGEEKWKYAGNRKFIAVKGAVVEFNREDGELSLGGNNNTALTMSRILQVKHEVKKERELHSLGMLPSKTCLHGCCNYESD